MGVSIKLPRLGAFFYASAIMAVLMCAASAQQGTMAVPSTQPYTASASQAATSNPSAELESLHQALIAARTQLIAASVTVPKDDAAIHAKAAAIGDAELALAEAQADNLGGPQATVAEKARRDRGGPVPNIPNLTPAQTDALTRMTGGLQAAAAALSARRNALADLALAQPRDDTKIKKAVDAVVDTEVRLANTRADLFAKLQSSPNALTTEQIAPLVAMGGLLRLGGFIEPRPIDFNDHDGYVSLFDGKTLNGWDGNPKIWRVENGTIIGESTPTNPSGNTYLVYRGTEAKDFDLKFEIKIDGNGGSGMQYRSKSGIPWLAPVAPNLQPVNLDWMLTGPQADFWPTKIYSGQFYSENTPMRIIAWRGQVVEGAGVENRRLMGTIGDRKALGDFEKKNDWNEYTVIARGGTFLHIMNGQLMSVLVDDDPSSSNNQPGLIGIEIESITKLYVRNIWLKKLN